MKSSKEKVEATKEVKEIDEYVKTFKHVGIGKEEAHLAFEHAKEKHGLFVHDLEYLDTKGDQLIKYLGLVPPGLAAISGYLGANSSFHSKWPFFVIIIMGIVGWIGAMFSALWVVRPTDMPYPPTTRNLFEEMKIKEENKHLESALALRYEQTNIRLLELGKIKGEWLKRGYMLTALSTFLLLVSLIVCRI